jgi:hypothetical protein
MDGLFYDVLYVLIADMQAILRCYPLLLAKNASVRASKMGDEDWYD